MKRTPVLIDVNGVPLRESLSYHGGGAGFGGQMAEWLPPAQSADAALLPALRLGNARADDLVRNNGIAANAVALHKDHIVGHMFLISYRPNWRCCGISPPVLVFPTNSCPVITRRSVTQVPAPPPMSRGAILWGGENLLRPGWPRRCFPAGWKRLFFGGLFVRHGRVLIFIRRDQPGHGQSGLVPEEWPLTGSRRSRNR